MRDEGSFSESNAQKLIVLDSKVQKILVILEGTGEDAPGLMARLSLVERVLFGKERQDEGMIYRVNVLWKGYIWILCTLSAAAGFGLRELVRIVWKV